ncbi:MAG: penicillin-binding protein 2 [Clostridiales bacterium]|nr:penicillin-binding protein 2 [Clostridiales bacterium]
MKQQRYLFKILALIMFGLFLLLAVYGGYSISTYGNRWFSFSRNPRVRAQKQTVIAGDILDRNGIVLATTVDGQRVYQQNEESRRAVVHLLGDSQGQVSNGVETFQTSYLYGFQTPLGERVSTLLAGETRRGDNVTLTIDSQLCTEIVRFFDRHSLTRGKRGAAVVMNYKTGELIASISLPNFDPMNITEATKADAGQPFWNRATQSVYPPGSSFKIITTVSALDNIPSVTGQEIACTGGLTVMNQTIHDYGGAIHEKLTLREAFKKSCNNVYAYIAQTLGDEKLRKTAESFGFNDNFLFRDLVVENSTYPTTNRNEFEIATTGIGQSALTATPMHMCMVAAAIANDGVMMEPRLLMNVQSAAGSTRATFQSKVYRTALSAENAATLQSYMRDVVKSGTGTSAAVPGLAICGKTGSAESSLSGSAMTYGWFIGYIENDDLPYAVSVLVESIEDGEGGGSTAAPIAADIFTYLKGAPSP